MSAWEREHGELPSPNLSLFSRKVGQGHFVIPGTSPDAGDSSPNHGPHVCGRPGDRDGSSNLRISHSSPLLLLKIVVRQIERLASGASNEDSCRLQHGGAS